MRAACAADGGANSYCARCLKLMTLDVSQSCIGPKSFADLGQMKVAELLVAPPLSLLQALTAARMLLSSSAAYPASRAAVRAGRETALSAVPGPGLPRQPRRYHHGGHIGGGARAWSRAR